jgi:C-terminal processing protease CtpA/Prc
MGIEMGRARTAGRAASAVMLVLATACASSSSVEPPPGLAHQRRPDRVVVGLSSRHPARTAPTRFASCPLPSPSAIPQLPLFSKTLFYVHANYPEDISPRARDLLLGALDAVAQQNRDILVEREPDPPPRWVTLTVDGQTCTLDLERVDAPWSLRSNLQQAFRFVEVHLAPAPSAESEQRLSNLELAAINGMLSALDRHSHLLDPETYRQVRAHLGPAAGAGPGTLRAQDPSKGSGTVTRPWAALFPRAALGRTIGYLRLPGFPPGASGELEKSLLAFEGASPKGFVLDLRDNSGGLLEEAVRVADAFIRAGSLGSIAGRRQRKDYVARSGGHEPGGALVVLVNRRTAGAAELVAAAVKNLGRGIVVGEPTAGAGMIDQMFEIPRPRRHTPDNVPPAKSVDELLEGDPLGLYLTTGRLLAAGGAEIEGAGVQPDVAMAWPTGEGARPDEDCLRQFAEALITRARDSGRSTLLAVAKAIPAEAACRSGGLRGL